MGRAAGEYRASRYCLCQEFQVTCKLCNMYDGGSKSFRPDQLFKMTDIKQFCYFSVQSPFISTHTHTDTLTSPQMVLYRPRSIFRLAQLLYVRPETSGPTLIYRVSQEECSRLREGVPYVKVYRYNPKHPCPKLNGYGDKGARKVWFSCGSTCCTWLA